MPPKPAERSHRLLTLEQQLGPPKSPAAMRSTHPSTACSLCWTSTSLSIGGRYIRPCFRRPRSPPSRSSKLPTQGVSACSCGCQSAADQLPRPSSHFHHPLCGGRRALSPRSPRWVGHIPDQDHGTLLARHPHRRGERALRLLHDYDEAGNADDSVRPHEAVAGLRRRPRSLGRDGGGTWRHIALIAALTHGYGCNPRSADALSPVPSNGV